MSLHAPLLGIGQVRHRRLRPAVNAFAYPTYFLLLPMRSLRAQPAAGLVRNRFGLLAFHDRDHGDGRGDALAWLDELLQREGVRDAAGEVWLHTYPRVLGYGNADQGSCFELPAWRSFIKRKIGRAGRRNGG
jgi:hypothetical protein